MGIGRLTKLVTIFIPPYGPPPYIRVSVQKSINDEPMAMYIEALLNDCICSVIDHVDNCT